MSAQAQYPVGKTIVWPHPSDGRTVEVIVTSHDIGSSHQVVAINVKGTDFLDGVAIGRLEADGSGLK